jgi:hypothetical protein
MPQRFCSNCYWTRTWDSHTRLETWNCLRSARSVATPHGRRVRCLSTNASTEHAVPSTLLSAFASSSWQRSYQCLPHWYGHWRGHIPELEKGRDGKICGPPGAQSLIPIPSISRQMTHLDPLALVRDFSVNVWKESGGPIGQADLARSARRSTPPECRLVRMIRLIALKRGSSELQCLLLWSIWPA